MHSYVAVFFFLEEARTGNSAYTHLFRNDVSAQLALYEAEYRHYLDVSGYSENVRRIVDESNGFSLFSDENSFEYKNGLKIADTYRPLFDVVPEYAPSEGVRSAASNPASDFALLIIACYAAVKLFSEERDNGCALLAASMRNGARRFTLAKLAAILLCAAAGSLLLSAESAVISELRLGLYDLSRAIQSVNGYYNSPLHVSAGEFLLISALTKALCASCFGFAAALFSVFFRQEAAFLISGIFAGVLAAVYRFVSSISVLAPLRCMSIFAGFDSESLYGIYLNINVFKTPVNDVHILLASAAAIALAAGFAIVFSYRKSCVPRARKTAFLGRKGYSVSICANELKRVFLDRKGAVVIVAGAVLGGAYISQIVRPLDVDDMMYADYIRELGGEVTEDTYALVAAERERYNEVNNSLADLQALYAQEKIDDAVFSVEYTALSKKLMGERSLRRVEEQLLQIEDNPNPELIYDTGWTRLFGGGISGSVLLSLIIAAVITALISPVYSSDNEGGMSLLISSSQKGSAKLMITRSVIAVITSASAALLAFGAELMRFSALYGLESIGSSVKNIAALSDFPFDISILAYLLALNGIRLVVWAAASLAVLLISRISPKRAISAAASGILLIVPILIR